MKREREIEVFPAGAGPNVRLTQRFLKGPIAISTIAQAARLPGKALPLYLAIRHQIDLTRKARVTLPKGLLSQLGISRDAKARALKVLTEAGLVFSFAEKGKTAMVELAPDPQVHRVMPVSNSQWAVTEEGLFCRTLFYPIYKDQLVDFRDETLGVATWPLQLASKTWVNIEEFIDAYTNALLFHRPAGANRIDLEETFRRARQMAVETSAVRRDNK